MIKYFVKNKNTSLLYEFDPSTGNLIKNFVTFEQLRENFRKFEFKEYYVGRPSIMGNPYSHLNKSLAKFKVKTVEDAVENYEKLYLPTIDNEIKTIKKEISVLYNLCSTVNEDTNNDLTPLIICLSCFCVPKKCHAVSIMRRICQ